MTHPFFTSEESIFDSMISGQTSQPKKAGPDYVITGNEVVDINESLGGVGIEETLATKQEARAFFAESGFTPAPQEVQMEEPEQDTKPKILNLTFADCVGIAEETGSTTLFIEEKERVVVETQGEPYESSTMGGFSKITFIRCGISLVLDLETELLVK